MVPPGSWLSSGAGWMADVGLSAWRAVQARARAVAGESGGCELCEAAPMTTWHHDDDLCWVADCDACGTPMVVWRRHGSEPPDDERRHMIEALTRVAAGCFGPGRFTIDPVMRQIPGHFHAHARPRRPA